jgi:hypothetical protein
MTTARFVLATDRVRANAIEAIRSAKDGSRVEIKAPKRSVDQNALLWARLAEISDQVIWYGTKLCAEDWKDVFSASLRKARVVPGLDPGTYVPLAMRTSDMSKEEFGLLLDLIDCFAAERGVVFRGPELGFDPVPLDGETT